MGMMYRKDYKVKGKKIKAEGMKSLRELTSMGEKRRWIIQQESGKQNEVFIKNRRKKARMQQITRKKQSKEEAGINLNTQVQKYQMLHYNYKSIDRCRWSGWIANDNPDYD